MGKTPFRLLAASAITATSLIVSTISASAHERRTVGGFQFVVGWKDEPTFTDTRNAVQLFLRDSGGNPVKDLGDSLKVEVMFGNQKTEKLDLEPAFGETFGTPGEYDAAIIPNRPGSYTFHFTGTVRGQAIDASFTSSEKTFDDVKGAASIQFPGKDPTRAEIAQRLDRMDSRSDTLNSRETSDYQTTRNLAIAGIVLGVLGSAALVIRLFEAVRRRRARIA